MEVYQLVNQAMHMCAAAGFAGLQPPLLILLMMTNCKLATAAAGARTCVGRLHVPKGIRMD